MNVLVEKYWRQSESNDGLTLRVLSSDYFSYEVDYRSLLQTNIKTGTRRVIRRVLPGATASGDAPIIIPEKVAPRKVPVVGDDGEDEADAEDAEDGDEDEDEAEEEAADEVAEGSVPVAVPETVIRRSDSAETLP